MKTKTPIFKKLFFLFFMLVLPLSLLTAAEFYWENPVIITDTEARFPLTLQNNDGQTYLFWQEIDSSNKQIYLSFLIDNPCYFQYMK